MLEGGDLRKGRLVAVVLSVLIVLTLTAYLYTSFKPRPQEPEAPSEAFLGEIGTAGKVKLTIVYDNNPYDQRLKTAWGFSCVVDLGEASILFDTGGNPDILIENMAELDVNMSKIEMIVLSHIHGDHVGGLFGVLERNSHVKVYVPASFSEDFKSKIKGYGCEVVEVKDATKICEGVATTGELGTGIKEQSLIVNTSKGVVVVTGCAHPGVANIVNKAKELTGEEIHLVLGGFHLVGKTKNEISSIITQLKDLGVESVAPCHCSGDLARAMLKESFGENYVDSGVGKIIVFSC